jgi:hypothetical protein
MSETNAALMPLSESVPGREKRSQNLSTKLTEAEARSIEQAALRAGKSPSEWAREVLLRGVHCTTPGTLQMHMFTELVAIELVVMNALEPLLRGEKLSREQAAQIFREVQGTKAVRAREILMKRSQTGEI